MDRPIPRDPPVIRAVFPLGSPTYDFYGADRHGTNLFSDCILAFDARTGKYIWHFQTIHHDLWDYDLMTGPKLMTIRHDEKTVDVVVQAGKTDLSTFLIAPMESQSGP
jgi:quinoprotein glucose dehydrogenase